MVPLARGWERQIDIADNRLFYGGRLTAASYEAWLHQLAVRYVAVADAPPDYSARAELRLIGGGLPYLQAGRALPHWRVYAVTDATPIATGGGGVEAMGAELAALDVTPPGQRLPARALVALLAAQRCQRLRRPAGAFTRVRARSSGTARLQIMASRSARIGADAHAAVRHLEDQLTNRVALTGL